APWAWMCVITSTNNISTTPALASILFWCRSCYRSSTRKRHERQGHSVSPLPEGRRQRAATSSAGGSITRVAPVEFHVDEGEGCGRLYLAFVARFGHTVGTVFRILQGDRASLGCTEGAD